MKIRPLNGRRIRIGRRLHVNQPLQFHEASKIVYIRFTQHAQMNKAFTVKIISKFQVGPTRKWTSELDSPQKVMPKYKILGQ